MSLQITVMSLDFESFSGPRTQTFSKPEITFGRLPTNDVVLETPEVSQRHARLRVKRDNKTGSAKIFVTDLGSTNGTMVENAPVTTRTDVEIASNVRIRIGNYLIKPSYVDDGLDDIHFEDHLASKSISNGHAAAVIDAFQPIEKISTGLSEMNFDEITEGNGEEVDTRSTRVFRVEDLERYSFRKNDAPAAAEPAPAAPAAEIAAAPEPEAKTEEPEIAAPVVEPALTAAAAPAAPVQEVEEIEVELPVAAVEKAAAAFENKEIADIEMEPAVELVYKSAPEFVATITGKTDVVDIGDLNFDAISLFTLSGKILHRGKPLAGVAVSADGLGSAVTDAEGTFVFDNIEEGTTYSLSVAKDRFRFDGGRRGVVMNDTSVVIDATKLVNIQGRIVHKGKPLAGVTIDGGALGTTTTKDDGTYLFIDVPENTEYTIKASKPGFKLR